jgi:HD-like signal output (HDOD) protein
MANSAHFGGGRKIGSVNDAVVLLGFNSLRTLVLASGITGAFTYPPSFDRNLFWKSSFETAAICKWLAKSSSEDRETAFTCGMLCDIGTILMVITFPDEMGDILKAAAHGGDRSALEQASLGVTAQEVTAELAHRWRFPEEIVEALRWQHQPADSQDSKLAYLLHLTHFIHLNRVDLKADELCERFPMNIAEKAGVNSAKVLADIDDVFELESDMEGLID